MIVNKCVCASAVLMMSAIAYGCTSLPESSRTATIHDVKVEERLSPGTIRVQPGDEVRWVNVRKLPAQVEVPTVTADDLSCQRGFTNWMGSFRDIARVKPNETVALCFKKPAIINYSVMAETSLGGGMQVLPGTVEVGGR